jgi:hypothetical protein
MDREDKTTRGGEPEEEHLTTINSGRAIIYGGLINHQPAGKE